MVFYAIEAEWEDTHDERLCVFLSDADPFLFEECSSADPSVFKEFCDIITEEEIAVEDSYASALRYLGTIKTECLEEAFKRTDAVEWAACVEEYLSEPHKGADWRG